MTPKSLRNVGLVIVGVVLLGWLMVINVPSHRHSGRPRSPCKTSLKQIGLALHNYHDAYAYFPPAYVAEESGKPMHSWRVLILPFLEEETAKTLYEQYKFNEPWNGPNNIKLLAQIPKAYRCDSETAANGTLATATYVAVVGESAASRGAQPVRVRDMVDGTSNSILVVEIADSVIFWTEPRDLLLDELSLAPNLESGSGLSSQHVQGSHVLLADGAVRFITDTINPKTLGALLTIDGGEPIEDF